MAKSRKNAALDSGRQHLATVYAKALVGAADKLGQAADVIEELGSVVDDVLDKLPTFDQALASPRITLEEKLALIDRAFAGKMSATLLNFLKVVAKHERLDCLRAIRRAAEKLYNQMQGLVEVTVETASPLNNQLAQKIVGRLTQLLGKQVVLATEINPDLLGGLVVRVGDTVYDASLAGQLSRMQGVTLEQTTQAIRTSLDKFAVST
ncbi:MAG: ATP synthase F1 subunit delta [Pirellulaceae bacterium]|nr:ATP synthase F1 subunit delta [Pirellulaceae bacterium]